jgi:hypothetical protein
MKLNEDAIRILVGWLRNIASKAEEIGKLRNEIDNLLSTDIEVGIPSEVYAYISIDTPKRKYYSLGLDKELMCMETDVEYDRVSVSVYDGKIRVYLDKQGRVPPLPHEVSIEATTLHGLLLLMCNLSNEDMENVLREADKTIESLRNVVEKLRYVLAVAKMVLQ